MSDHSALTATERFTVKHAAIAASHETDELIAIITRLEVELDKADAAGVKATEAIVRQAAEIARLRIGYELRRDDVIRGLTAELAEADRQLEEAVGPDEYGRAVEEL